MKLTEVIYPTGMKTLPNEELFIDQASGKTFKELYPSMYKKGYAFIGIYCSDDGIYFIEDDDAEEYLKKQHGMVNLYHSYDKGFHYYSEWQREALK